MGQTSAGQPAVVEAGSRKPQITIYGSGFPPGDIISADVLAPEGEYLLDFLGGNQVVSDAGTFESSWRASKRADVSEGLHTVRVLAGPSGAQASAPLIVTAPKE